MGRSFLDQFSPYQVLILVSLIFFLDKDPSSTYVGLIVDVSTTLGSSMDVMLENNNRIKNLEEFKMENRIEKKRQRSLRSDLDTILEVEIVIN